VDTLPKLPCNLWRIKTVTPQEFDPVTSENAKSLKPIKNKKPLSRRGFLFLNGTPKGIRIPVARMKTVCPRPLDDGGTI
jgi:hypothetical protein